MKTKDLANIFFRERRENASKQFFGGGGRLEIEKNFFTEKVFVLVLGTTPFNTLPIGVFMIKQYLI